MGPAEMSLHEVLYSVDGVGCLACAALIPAEASIVHYVVGPMQHLTPLLCLEAERYDRLLLLAEMPKRLAYASCSLQNAQPTCHQ